MICEKQKVIELTQVSVHIDIEKTYNREVSALLKASDTLRCNNLTLVTMKQSQHHDINNKHINEFSIIVKAILDEKEYQTGIVVTEEQIGKLNIEINELHGKWNYTIKPNLK